MTIPKVLAKPYLLQNTIQHYAWGTSGPNAYIPRLLGIAPEANIPYAELWLGAHPTAPSRAVVPDASQASEVFLDQWIDAYPEAILGARVSGAFDGKLPFLTKVLSAGASLSIQAHPDKAQAAFLHALDPEHYADDNHKPEIAVALDRLTALMGFKAYSGILQTFEAYPELADFLGRVLVDHLKGAATASLDAQRIRVHLLFDVLVKRAIAQPAIYAAAVASLATRLRQTAADETGQLFLAQQQRYGNTDIGLFALLLFNLVHLAPGEALYTPAGVPHAYLGGNIIECMANSDNVVRVGLTPKFKDVGALLGIIDATPQTPQVMAAQTGARETLYRTPAREFELTRWALKAGGRIAVHKREGPAILIVTEGSVVIEWAGSAMAVQTGESVLVPHILEEYWISAASAPAQIFRTRVPGGTL